MFIDNTSLSHPRSLWRGIILSIKWIQPFLRLSVKQSAWGRFLSNNGQNSQVASVPISLAGQPLHKRRKGLVMSHTPSCTSDRILPRPKKVFVLMLPYPPLLMSYWTSPSRKCRCFCVSLDPSSEEPGHLSLDKRACLKLRVHITSKDALNIIWWFRELRSTM